MLVKYSQRLKYELHSSDFGQTTYVRLKTERPSLNPKLDCFLLKKNYVLISNWKKLSENRTSNHSDFGVVWISDVWFLDVDCIFLLFVSNEASNSKVFFSVSSIKSHFQMDWVTTCEFRVGIQSSCLGSILNFYSTEKTGVTLNLKNDLFVSACWPRSFILFGSFLVTSPVLVQTCGWMAKIER